LLCAASTSTDKLSKKIHAILVGDPGLAKSQLLKEATKLVPNSRYESVQFATGKSLTAIVTKEEGDALILRIGPIPQAKGAIAALNEIGRMRHEDQGFMLDTMQEQEFTTNKFGQNFHVDAPTAIIASANPEGGSWKGGYEDSTDDKIDLDKIPMIKPLVDRFDLIFALKDSRDEQSLIDYADRKSQMENHKIPDYSPLLSKYIMYAKQRYSRIKFSDEAIHMLNRYYVQIRKSYGSPRIRETIYRIAENIARLKLKNVVDDNDAKETMQFYNVILQQINKVITMPSSPRDITYERCLRILKDSDLPITFEELIKQACDSDTMIKRYIGKSLKLSDNFKLRPIQEKLGQHSRVKIVQMKPLVLQYIEEIKTKTKSDNPSQEYDAYDAYDVNEDTLVKNLGTEIDQHMGEDTYKKFAGASDKTSHTSYTSYGNSNSNSSLLRCYYCEIRGSIFETNSESEYHKHGNQKHFNKSMYPSIATIQKYNLKPQGKEWEF
jgi:replicative DNA helicase Mcm